MWNIWRNILSSMFRKYIQLKIYLFVCFYFHTTNGISALGISKTVTFFYLPTKYPSYLLSLLRLSPLSIRWVYYFFFDKQANFWLLLINSKKKIKWKVGEYMTIKYVPKHTGKPLLVPLLAEKSFKTDLYWDWYV